ncbi:Major facilitator superfamily domain-containing protein 6 [Holothuria leucospilota]|uniref:Major facilitator superfamily domain-containing protein 6 n=1 Tax=Holothuria leucospilota TaxID=206669 RepID=A0A9Q1C296_HOLLE|nr:Major facilitator superfamily domain-containing protein 6 [Holothuria leucospilota]
MSTSISRHEPTGEDEAKNKQDLTSFEKEQFLSESSEQDNKGQSTNRRSVFRINIKFIPVKLVYFFMGSAIGVSIPFVPLYLYQLGLTTVRVGVITSLRAVMALIATPLWGSIADKFKLHRFLYLCCIIGICVAPFSLILIPPVPNDLCRSPNISSGYTVGTTNSAYDTDTNKKNPSIVMTTPDIAFTQNECDISRHNSVTGTFFDKFPSPAEQDTSNESNVVVGMLSVHSSTHYDEVTTISPPFERRTPTGSSVPTFATAFCCMFFIYMFVVNYHVFSDCNAIELCKRYEESTYGQQRWVASLSVIVTSFSAGVLMEWSEKRFNTDGKSCYDGRYFLPLVLVTALCAFLSCFPFCKMEVVSKEPSKSISKSVFKLLSNFYVFRFFVAVTVSGASKGIITTYLFLFLQDLNAPKILIGLCFTFQCIAEMPCMMFSQNVIRLVGTRAVINIGILGFAVRLIGLSFLHNPWLVIPLEVLHGMAYGLLWPSFVVYGNQIAPEGMAATLQSMVAASNEGFGEKLLVF